LLTQGFLFAFALAQTILGITPVANAPILLLAFTMLVAAEHALNLTLKYAGQFSKSQDGSVSEFNMHALDASLNRLYHKLGWDGVVFGAGFLLSVGVATFATSGTVVGFLADPSLYAIIVSLSVGMLIVLKTE
jgi:hypothetical protein